MVIIADENIDQHLIRELRNKGYSVYAIRENMPGISDREIISMLNKETTILITEDKDFGEFVFAHEFRDVKIIFLRYFKDEVQQIINNIEKACAGYLEKQGNYFITITPKKIRIKNL